MSEFFREYDAAIAAARTNANTYKHDYGIEKCKEFGRSGFRVFMLPMPQNRYGHGRTCEVVQHDTNR